MKTITCILSTAFMALLALPLYGQSKINAPLEAMVTVRAVIPDDARTARALGTLREGNGIIIDSDGLVLTIGYVILEAQHLELEVRSGKTIPASFVGYDHRTGFGLLRARKPLKGKPLKFGNSSKLETGDPVMVLTSGGDDPVQGARVLSRAEFAGYWEYLLDSAIYAAPANSDFAGAALVGPKGRLLGIGSIYTQLAIPALGNVPCNMYVPIDLLKPVLEDLINSGRSRKPPQPWLGVHLDETYGRVIVMRTARGGPAERAGLKTGDIIIGIGGKPVQGLSDFYRKLWAIGKAGVMVPLSILQGNEIRKFKIPSEDRYKYLKLRPGSKYTKWS
ncbi:hypothetical protein D3OALGA1CA_2852 [Olavius algarvensis associated proteobacterium Delta 3]|nr:hypothetical protein D3OALGA1CA_2852 [Olavius algarvensis associated proteobacterium Delta 3]